LERLQPQTFNVLRNGFFIDRLYDVTIIRFNGWCARACDWLDRWIWGGAVRSVSYLVLGLSRVNRSVDVFVVNWGFDRGCNCLTLGGRILSRLQSGRMQNYLRIVGIAFAALVLFLMWGKRG
jgi:NADH-quinone oxidoreductase subunit L